MSGNETDGDFPRPVIDLAIEPKDKADYQRLSLALAHIAADDPSFRVKTDEESGQTIISGTGELHLDCIVERLKAELGVGLNVGAPQIAYRETISKTVEHDYAHKREAGGAGQFARIKFRIEPDPSGGEPVFVSTVAAGNVPVAFIPAVEKGVRSVMAAGPIIGFPMVGMRFILLDGAYHDIDSSALAFEAAGRAGFKEAIVKAGPKILEPVMAVEVVTPAAHVGEVVGDLKKRRAIISGGNRAVGAEHVITAIVPLANLFGYVNSLRSITVGAGRYSMGFDHYAIVPDAVQPDDDPPFGGAMAMRA